MPCRGNIIYTPSWARRNRRKWPSPHRPRPPPKRPISKRCSMNSSSASLPWPKSSTDSTLWVFPAIHLRLNWLEIAQKIAQKLVEIWLLFGKKLDRYWSQFACNMVKNKTEIGQKLVKNWSKIGPSLVKNWLKIGQKLDRYWSQFACYMVKNKAEIGQKLVGIWSKMGQKLVKNWSNLDRNESKVMAVQWRAMDARMVDWMGFSVNCRSIIRNSRQRAPGVRLFQRRGNGPSSPVSDRRRCTLYPGTDISISTCLFSISFWFSSSS